MVTGKQVLMLMRLIKTERTRYLAVSKACYSQLSVSETLITCPVTPI